MTVSVVIPTFNRAHRIGDAIRSVLAQGCSDIEIIVIDDGSTDATRDIVRTFGGAVRYVYQDNAGAGMARNQGLRQSRGQYIAFLDSDDTWQPWKLGLQLRLLEAHPDVGLVFSDFVIVKPTGQPQQNGAARWAGRPLTFPGMREHAVRRPDTTQGASWPADEVRYFVGSMYRQLLEELPILTSSVVVRRSCLDDSVRFTPERILFEDWEFFARVARRSAIAYIDAETTMNVGHDEPGRISRCDALTRARSYVALLERVWMQDAGFSAAHQDALMDAYGRGLLAIARQALLAGQRAEARLVLENWRRLSVKPRPAWALAYRLCLTVPGGSALLRVLLRAARIPGLFSPRFAGVPQCVNPAA